MPTVTISNGLTHKLLKSLTHINILTRAQDYLHGKLGETRFLV
jgi:hypothetical protein